MNGKAHSLEMLSVMIDISQKYIHDSDLRGGIIRKCHQEIGMNLIDAPATERAGIPLSDRESAAVRKAIQRWRRDRKHVRDKPKLPDEEA